MIRPRTNAVAQETTGRHMDWLGSDLDTAKSVLAMGVIGGIELDLGMRDGADGPGREFLTGEVQFDPP